MHRRAPRPRFAIACLGLAWLALVAGACSTAHEAQADTPTHIVIVIAEPEYETDRTLPAFAEQHWTEEHGYRVTVVAGDPSEHDIPGLIEAVNAADVLVLSVRRQALPEAQLLAIREYLEAGMPLLAIRTSSHAFALRGNRGGPPDLDGRLQWPQFDADVLGGNYHGHYGHDQTSRVTVADGAEDHPVLAGITPQTTSNAAVYKNNPLAEGAQPLLIAHPEGHDPEPVAWTHRFDQARVFYTSLGNAGDFEQPGFVQLLNQAMRWLVTEQPEETNP